MRVQLYVVVGQKETTARWTMAPEVDYAYWLDAAYRQEVGRAAAGCETAGGNYVCCLFWSELVPLGDAEQIAVRWAEEQGQTNDIRATAAKLRRLVGQTVRLRSGRGEVVMYRHDSVGLKGKSDYMAARRLAEQAFRLAKLCRGRSLLMGEVLALLEASGQTGQSCSSALLPVLQMAALLGLLHLGGSVAVQPPSKGVRWICRLRGGTTKGKLRCRRCGSGEARMRRTGCATCGCECAYCEACLSMGRSRECSLLILGDSTAAAGAYNKSGSRLAIPERLRPWKLSDAQAAATAAALDFIEQRPRAADRFLLWAVTGAGKTEMIFPLVEACLQQGGYALIATPRRDVVLELDPRLRKAFPSETLVTLYGGSAQRWESGRITLATTHQLFRFQHAFELVVIDELDAFPYHGDPLLYYAAAKVCKPEGTTILLSATPPAELQRAARRRKLPYVRVPVRFHRHPLPVPAYIKAAPVYSLIAQRQLPAKVISAARHSLDRGAQLFVFVQKISHIAPLVEQLRRAFPKIAIDGTSSKDEERADKVQQFRQCHIRLLVTTTILERGVTVPKSDVMILDADGKLFDEASLVQMAGRAGRSKDDPAGNVYFCAPALNRSQKLAIRQIVEMNRLARRQGYLITVPDRRGNRNIDK
ncbi:DEAD/DEAH box helicase [Paenibacillus sp. GCM10027626]|uniref:DEAD/DEAH box helicase n=1 Tax=Paenibacillus sp. GCM10027626 TaxID=3273411 RepID=UPI00363650CB